MAPTVPPSTGELIDALTAVASLSDEAAMLALLGQPAEGAPMNDNSDPFAGVSALKLALMAKQVRAQAAQALQADPIASSAWLAACPAARTRPIGFWQLHVRRCRAVGRHSADRWNGDALV